MSTILYVKNQGFYTDSCYLTIKNKLIEKTFNTKITVNQEKTIAYTYSGHCFIACESDMCKYIEKLIEMGRNEIVRNDFIPKDGLVPVSGDLYIYDNRDHSAYHYDNETNSWYNITNVEYRVSGSGDMIALAILRLTGNPLLAMREAIGSDRYSQGDINYLLFNDMVTRSADPNKGDI